MVRPGKLDESGVAALVAAAPQWERRGDTLFRSFRFGNFRRAFGFMTQLAMVAEQLFDPRAVEASLPRRAAAG